MISPCDSMKQPGKPEEGFVDDPKADDDLDGIGRVKHADTYVFSHYSSYDHDEKVDPYHYDRADRNKKKKGR